MRNFKKKKDAGKLKTRENSFSTQMKGDDDDDDGYG
jgi:hypothetical protein